MPAILVKGLSPALHRKLRQVARRHRRSMTQEALTLLENALKSEGEVRSLPPALQGRFPVTKEFVDRAKRTGRM